MTRSTGSRVGVQRGALVFLGSMLLILIITQGVRAGEKVIVSDLARLAPGMAVCAVSAHEQ
jgi:hypothetical protein